MGKSKDQKLEALPSWIGITFTQQERDLGIISQDKVGTSRQASYYTINTPLYELSNGKYGYDDVNHKMGEVDVVSGSIKQQFDWFKSVLVNIQAIQVILMVAIS